MDAGTYRFPRWELRPQERLLLVDRIPAKIGSRAFDVLLALVQRRGQVVTRAELMDAAWPGLVVEENNLSVQISALRKVLGASSIVNVSGHGYQLAAVVDSATPPLNETSVEAPASRRAELFGRDAEVGALVDLVKRAQLVSIIGTGGVGKTSLARAVLAAAGNRWRDGVHWIDLSSLREGAPLSQIVGKSLGVIADDLLRDADDLVRSLSKMRALVALDNCEHLLDEVSALVAPLLRSAPGICWLITSHEPLHLVDESVYRLGPLDVPLPGVTPEEAVRYGAVAMLCSRAGAADRQFDLTAERVEAAIDLCRQLDGLPLAIEMAAARVATLGLQGVRDQIDQRLKLRASSREAPPRHHTLLQTFEWSYGLLSAVEQCVFRRLEPFAGGFSGQLAQQLCCGIAGDHEPLEPWSMLDALSALVDKSLVQRNSAPATGTEERFYLHEAARDYARLRLEATSEIDAVQERHAKVIADYFATAQHELERWRDRDWLQKYHPERRNVCVALTWACSVSNPELVARLVAALAQLDDFGNAQSEVVRYPVLPALLEKAEPAVRARAFLALGWANYLDGNRGVGTELCLRALADFESLGDAAGTYASLMRLIRLYDGRPGMESRARETWSRLKEVDESQVPLRLRLICHSTVALLFDGARSVERLQELHRIAQHAGFDAQAAVCRLHITDELLRRGRFEEAVETSEAMLKAGEPLVRVRALICHNRAHALISLGRIEEAKASAQAMLRALPSYSHMIMDLFALVALREGRREDAALMAGCSARIKLERDIHNDPSEAALIFETLEQLERGLGRKRMDELMRQGSAMSTNDVLSLAWSGSSVS